MLRSQLMRRRDTSPLWWNRSHVTQLLRSSVRHLLGVLLETVSHMSHQSYLLLDVNVISRAWRLKCQPHVDGKVSRACSGRQKLYGMERRRLFVSRSLCSCCPNLLFSSSATVCRPYIWEIGRKERKRKKMSLHVWFSLVSREVALWKVNMWGRNKFQGRVQVIRVTWYARGRGINKRCKCTSCVHL